MKHDDPAIDRLAAERQSLTRMFLRFDAEQRRLLRMLLSLCGEVGDRICHSR
jgi:hypothetical protein